MFSLSRNFLYWVFLSFSQGEVHSLALDSQIGEMLLTLMFPCKITSSEWSLSLVTRLNAYGNSPSQLNGRCCFGLLVPLFGMLVHCEYKSPLHAYFLKLSLYLLWFLSVLFMICFRPLAQWFVMMLLCMPLGKFALAFRRWRENIVNSRAIYEMRS